MLPAKLIFTGLFDDGGDVEALIGPALETLSQDLRGAWVLVALLEGVEGLSAAPVFTCELSFGLRGVAIRGEL